MDGDRHHQASSPSIEAGERHSVIENDHSIESDHVIAVVDTERVDNERDDTTAARHDVTTVGLSAATEITATQPLSATPPTYLHSEGIPGFSVNEYHPGLLPTFAKYQQCNQQRRNALFDRWVDRYRLLYEYANESHRNTGHSREIDELQTQLIAREQKVTELNEQLDEMHAELAKRQEQLWNEEEKKRSYDEAIIELQEECARLRARVGDPPSDYERLRLEAQQMSDKWATEITAVQSEAEELRRRWSNLATQHNVLYERLQLCEQSLRLKNNELAEAARKIRVLERERDYTEIAPTAKVGSRSDQCMGHSDQLHSASVRPEVTQLPSRINSRSTPVESRPLSPTFQSKAQLPNLVLARETNVSVQHPDLGVAALLQQMALTQQTLAASLSSPSFSPHRALDAQAMPRFSGDLSERSFDRWEADFVDFTSLVGASTDQQKLWWLKCALKDLALKYFDNLPTIVRNDYNESMAKLKARFVNPQSLTSAMTVFTSRTMQPDESVMEFGTDLERLSRPALIKMDAESADSMLAAIFSRNILERWRNASLHEQDNASFEQRFRSVIQEEQRVKAFKALGSDKEGKKKPTDRSNHPYSQTRKIVTNPDKASHPNEQTTIVPSASNSHTTPVGAPPSFSSANRTEPRRNAQGQLQCYKDGCRDTDGSPGFHNRILDCPDPSRPHNQSMVKQSNAQVMSADGSSTSLLSTKEMLLQSSAMLLESRDLSTPRPFIDILMGPEGLRQPPLAVSALVDSGCSSSLISFDLCTEYLKRFKGVINAHDVLVDTRLEVRGVSGTPLTVDVALRVPLQYNEYRSECLLYVMREANHPFLLGTDIFPLLGGLNNLLGGVNFAVIMGPTRPIVTPDIQVAEARDLIHRAWQVLDGKDAVNRENQTVDSSPNVNAANACFATLSQPQILHAGRTTIISVDLNNELKLCDDEVTYFRPDVKLFQQTGLDCPDAIIAPREGKVKLFAKNWLTEPVMLEAGQLIGTVEPAVLAHPHENDVEISMANSVVAANGAKHKPYMNGGWRTYDNAYPPQSQERIDQLHTQVGVNNSNLNDEERRQVRELLTEYADVFALTDDERGENDWYKFVIDTGDAVPINQSFRRVPLNKRQIIEAETTRMLRLGLIEPSTSSWSSPVNIVTKKDGKHRFVCDFRRVNSVTKKIASKLPRIDDLIDQMNAAQYFSSMDMVMGFWQTILDPATADRSAFATHQGNFQHRVLPQGLTNSPAQFSRVVATVFAGLNTPEDSFLGYYLDDICVYSRDFMSHLQHLKLVFERMRTACLLLKARKCEFMQEEIEFLGYQVGRKGVRPIPAKMQGIIDYPIPCNVKEMQSFLGMCAWYRKWIRSFASIAAPLYQLTRKGQLFEWGEDQHFAFQTLKKHLTAPPILQLPDMSRGWIIETDASDRGIGATLNQLYDDGLHLVQCVSRALNDAESRYSITEKETLAVVYACKAFHPYLLHSLDIEIITDHKSTGAMLLGGGDLPPKHYRWLQVLAELNPKIRYRAGTLNIVADALSRHPSSPATDDEGNESLPADPAAMFINLQPDEDKTTHALVAASDVEKMVEEARINRKKQLDDPALSELVAFYERGIQPQASEARQVIKNHGASLQMEEGVLYFSDDDQEVPDGLRMVVPEKLRRPLFDECHAGLFAGHLNERRIWGTMKRYWWWPRMRPNIRTWTHSCMRCAKNNPGRTRVPPLTSIVVGGPLELVSVDVLQLPLTSRQNKYAVVYVDHLTKWPEVYAVADQTAETLAQTFTDFVSRHSAPNTLLSDQGTPFMSTTFQKVVQLVGTKQTMATAHHHNTVGQCERFNNTLMNMLRKSGERFPDMWDSKLSNTLFAFRASPSASTGYTPFELLYGRQARLPTQHALNRSPMITDLDVSDYATVLSASLSEAWRNAKMHIDASQHAQKRQYDKRATEPAIHPGDRVFMLNPDLSRGPNHKLLFSWEGPMKVIDVTATNNAIVKHFKYPLLPAQEVAMERLVKARKELPDIDPEEHDRRRRRPPQLHQQFPPPDTHKHEHTHSTRSKNKVIEAQSLQTIVDHGTEYHRKWAITTDTEVNTHDFGAPAGNEMFAPSSSSLLELRLPHENTFSTVGTLGGNAEEGARENWRYTPLPKYMTDGQAHCYMFQANNMDQPIMFSDRESIDDRIRRELGTDDAPAKIVNDQSVCAEVMETTENDEKPQPVPIVGALTGKGVFVATNLFIRRGIYGEKNSSAQQVRTNYRPERAVVTGLATHQSFICQTACCTARRQRGDPHYYCKPITIGELFASQYDQRVVRRINSNPRIAEGVVGSVMDLRHYGALLMKMTDAADQLVMNILACPTLEDRLEMYWARIAEVMDGDSLPPLSPLHKMVHHMTAALADNCRVFTEALESTEHLPIFDVTTPPDRHQVNHHDIRSITEGHEMTRRDAYASALERVRYKAWLREKYPIIADGMVHVVGGDSAKMFAQSLSPETRKLTTIDCDTGADLQWVTEQLKKTTLLSTVTHLIISIDMPAAVVDEESASKFAQAYAALDFPPQFTAAIHLVLMGPLPRPGSEAQALAVNMHLQNLQIDRGMVIAEYPLLMLGKEMADRSSWDVQQGHLNFIGGYKIAAQLQQRGVPWIAMPIESLLTQASQYATPRLSKKRQTTERTYPMLKRPPGVHHRVDHEPRLGGGADLHHRYSSSRSADREPHRGGGVGRADSISHHRR